MELSEIRQRIDIVDDEMLRLFLERMELSEKVAKIKSLNSMPILNRAREREILSDMTEKAPDKEKYVYRFFETLMSLSKARQTELISAPSNIRTLIEKASASADEVFPHTGTVACQGIEGANSQVACDKLLPRGHIVYMKTFEAVFDAVSSGLCKFGVLPIENSSYGSVRTIYDLLQKKHCYIVRDTRLCIRHELMAKPGTKLADITEIYSHEQAIGQCSSFLASLSGVKVIPCGNTAVAAKMVSESGNPHAAAISSHPCAALYGLETISTDIQDSDNNYTRFICITRDPVIYAGSNKISLITASENRPGALHEILARFSAAGANMSKLESCPVQRKDFEFIFFIELDASVKDPGIISMLEDMERNCENFIFLGSYSEV
jgi:chorismate mutase/prephenate dehydratase